MKMRDWEKFIAGLHDYLGRAFAPVGDRLKALESKVATLEAEAAQREYKGVYEENRKYLKGNSVTRSGNVFICVADETQQRPGESPDWKLAVRAGRDAR